MKKVLIIFSLTVSLILSCLTSFSVYADDIDGDGVFRSDFYTREFFVDEYYKSVPGEYYFYFQYHALVSESTGSYHNAVRYFQFDDPSIVDVDDDPETGIVTINLLSTLPIYYKTKLYYSNGNSGTGSTSTTNNYTAISYDRNTNEVKFYRGSSVANTISPSMFHGLDTNIFDLNSDDSLDVKVTFNPALVGSVDRSLTLGDGTSSYRSNMLMTVENNTASAIQYSMKITKKNQVTSRFVDDSDSDSYFVDRSDDSVFYDSDPIFEYYSKAWVYGYDYDSFNSDTVSDEGNGWSSITPGYYSASKVYKATFWHYLSAKSHETVSFNFNQINLTEGEEYIVTVQAVKIDSDLACLKTNSLLFKEHCYDPFAVSTVYESSFSMLQYKDVVYDPSSSANGVLPYDGTKGVVDGRSYQFSRDAKENDDGSIDYESKDFYNDDNFWSERDKNFGSSSSGSSGSIGSSGSLNSSSSGAFNNLLTQTNSVFKFLSTVLGYFPSTLITVFNLGFWSLLILAIVRRLH